MKIAIVFYSKNSSLKLMIQKFTELLVHSFDLFDLSKINFENITISNYDFVAIGSCIYYGKINKNVNNFIKLNKAFLAKKPYILFCSAYQKKWENQLKNSFSKDIYNSSIANFCFGYGFNKNNMSFIDKLLYKLIAKGKCINSKLYLSQITKVAKLINTF